MFLNTQRLRLFLEGVKQEYDLQVLSFQSLQTLGQSLGTWEISTTAPTQPGRQLCSSDCHSVTQCCVQQQNTVCLGSA